ncbi:MAG: hypothetical protein NZ899_09970 [Thermoguttaceae bacterium]|nr:hypothetical protein [Thermoguttaceae bacterium]MDW8077546.1 hypothetical protein [Thermoguttaceae bacterium]
MAIRPKVEIGADEEPISQIHDALFNYRRELRRRDKDPHIRMRRYRGSFDFYPAGKVK